ncbi:hypothetical protein [Planctomycetes bacterium CA13]
MAVDSHPAITDSDSVPSLDLLFTNEDHTKPAAPKNGNWFDPVTQFLDLPTGRMLVVYEPEFFEEGSEQEADHFEINSRKDENLNSTAYTEAASYVVRCEPGFYRATAFTRFLHEDLDKDVFPQLAIFLSHVKKPTSFRMSDAILPIHPPSQDFDLLRRASKGLPPKKKQPKQKPKLLKNGEYWGSVRSDSFTTEMEMPKSLQNNFGLHPGLLVSLQIDEMELTGVIIEGAVPDPTSWDLIEKEKRKAKNFATFRPIEDSLQIELIKKSRKAPFKLSEHETVTGTLRILKNESGEARSIAAKQSAIGNPTAMEIPKQIGKPGECIAKLIPQMEKCFAWTQSCLFEIDGKTMIGAVNVNAPFKPKDSNNKDHSMPAEITASVSEFINGGPANETSKHFRGWPDGVGRAFLWVAKQGKGGSLWSNRFELDLNFWGFDEELVTQKDAQKDAIEAWKEIFGLL